MSDITQKELVKVYPSHADAAGQVNTLLGEIDKLFDTITKIVNLNPTVTVQWCSPADHWHTFASEDYENPNEGIDEDSDEYDWEAATPEYPGQWYSS